ncbi:MAG: hypothetical protein KAJ23_07155 [Maribacter sp.]|nr:hypothetical protein [Maribacter sp.]
MTTYTGLINRVKLALNWKVKPPLWFWIVSAVAFVWNALGVDAYLSDAYMRIEALEKMSQAERLLFESQLAWITAAIAIAV